MATAKQRAWRAKFAQRYGGRGRKRAKKRGGTMGRKGKKRYKSGNGFMSIFKPLVAGAVAPAITSRIGLNLPIGVESAGAGYLMSRSPKGLVLGWIGGKFLAPALSGVLGGAVGTAMSAKPANPGGW